MSATLLVLASLLPAADPVIAEPAGPLAATMARTPERDRWSWNRLHATPQPTGDLAWAPEPFRYTPAGVVRHIDFAAGSDDGDGSRQRPWRHHPWDPAATGAAKAATGAATYVFKRGVVYRGSLTAPADTTARLTSDPAWGSGEAVISGARRVTGWKQGSTHPRIPEGARVWTAEVDWFPRNLWLDAPQGCRRLALARMPNWTVSDPDDPLREWWTWQQPEWWKGLCTATVNGVKMHAGIDAQHLGGSAQDYVGAIVRSEYGIVMGTPFPSRVEGFDAKKKALHFQGIWFKDSEKIITGNRYYLEDMPNFLDADHEFWVEPMGKAGGRIHLRLPDGVDPNVVAIEAGREVCGLTATAADRLVVSGLVFRHGNTHRDLALAGWGHADVANAAIRVKGTCADLTVTHCRFDQVPGRALIVEAKGGAGRLLFADNDASDLDHGIVDLQCGGAGAVQVLRNRCREIGFRPHRQIHGHGIVIGFPETMEVAGNVVERISGSGIFVFGGKGSGDARQVGLSRSLIHGNRVSDSLLTANDWGGIETWQHGPHYVYNNLSARTSGYWSWGYNAQKPGSAGLGFAYYFDGSFKNWVFNNIAIGRTADPASNRSTHAAFYQAVQNVENVFFNNTATRCYSGSNWSPAGGRNLFLGNVFDGISGPVFLHSKMKEDADDTYDAFPTHTTAYAGNVIAQHGGGVLARIDVRATDLADVAALRQALEHDQAIASDVGVQTGEPVLRDRAAGDARLRPGAPAIDRGVRVFVPWALAHTVGEWQFRRDRAHPELVRDSAWNPGPAHLARPTYFQIPPFDLVGEGLAADSFGAGPLEDWCDGALRLDGTARLVLTQAAMEQGFTLSEVKKGKKGAPGGPQEKAIPPRTRMTADAGTGSLIVEAVVQAEPGQAAALVAKHDGATGYQVAVNRAGGVAVAVMAGGVRHELAGTVRIADGGWHHVLAEFDRAAGRLRLFVDGMPAGELAVALPADASIDNPADLVVGAGFRGRLEFLRLARSSLAESRTTIAELYDWEFDGPQNRDFAGIAPAGRRDAGALESRP